MNPWLHFSLALLTAKVETRDYASLYKFEKFPYNFEKCLDIANKNRPDLKAYENTIKAIKGSAAALVCQGGRVCLMPAQRKSERSCRSILRGVSTISITIMNSVQSIFKSGKRMCLYQN